VAEYALGFVACAGGIGALLGGRMSYRVADNLDTKLERADTASLVHAPLALCAGGLALTPVGLWWWAQVGAWQ
jgi:hypothetical protein